MRNYTYLIVPALVLVMLALPSCSLYAKLSELSKATTVQSEKIDSTLATVQTSVAMLGEQGAKLAEKISETRTNLAQADRNHDGVFSGSEWFEVILVLLGLFGVGKYAKTVHEKIETTDEKRSENAKTFYAEISAIKQKLAELSAV